MCVCVCVPSLLLLPLSKVLVSSDTTVGRDGASASITGDGGVAAVASSIWAELGMQVVRWCRYGSVY